VYVSRMRVDQERERDELDIEAEGQRLQFYAVSCRAAPGAVI
jgi:hypothetical protein